MEADWKLKVEVGGRLRFRISRCRWDRIERISIACGVGMASYRGDVPVKRVRNSVAAASGKGGRRWLNRVLMGAWLGGMRRTRRPDEMVDQS